MSTDLACQSRTIGRTSDGQDDQEDQEDLRTLTSQQPRPGGGRWQSMAAPTERSRGHQGGDSPPGRAPGCGRAEAGAGGRHVGGRRVTLNVLGPLVLGHATDLIVNGSLGHGIDFGRLHTVLLEAAALYAGSAVFTLFSAYTLTGVVQRLMQNLRRSVEAKIHALPLSYIDRGSRGDLLSRVTNDIDNLAQSLQQTMSQMLNSLLLVIGVAIMMFTISPLLAAVALTTVPVSVFAMRTIARRARPRFISQWRATGALNGIAEEVFSGHAVVKAFGRQREVEARFRATNDELFESAFRAQFMSSVMQPVTMFLGNIQYLLVAVVGGLRVASGAITIGDIQALIQYTRQLSMPITQLASMMNLFQSGMASLERVLEVLDAEEESPDPLPLPSRPTLGRVAFEDVTFSYHPRVRLIQSLSLVAEAGETVAIVGPTGAGKTTLVNLLMRFYEVDSGPDHRGRVRHRARCPGPSCGPRWAWCSRTPGSSPAPFATTSPSAGRARPRRRSGRRPRPPTSIASSIRSRTGTTPSSMRRPTTSAPARSSSSPSPGPSSPGPSVLILDEATSSVDTRTEVQIQLAMNRLRSQRTSFVIAHRLSTIRGADIILVMEDGSIVEQGSHAELLARDGAYARLYKSQFVAPVAEVD